MENRDEFAAFVLFASVTTAVAYVSFRFLETPANRLVRRGLEKSA
jgi:peptidoglycan/LPS O-acetylase OafA/YrhL